MRHPEQNPPTHSFKTILLDYGPPLLIFLAITGTMFGLGNWFIQTQVTLLLTPTTANVAQNSTDIKTVKNDFHIIKQDIGEIKESIARIEGYLTRTPSVN